MRTSLKRAFPIVVAIAMLGMIASCNVTKDPDTTAVRPAGAAAPPDEELRRAVKGANLQGFWFGMEESDSSVTTSFTSGAVKGPINLDRIDTLPLRYTSVRDKKSRETKSYRTDVVKKDGALAIVITDLATGAIVETRALQAADDPENTMPPPPGGYDSLDQCIDAFECGHGGQLQCDANRTCKTQSVGITCCLKSGECYSVHLAKEPRNPKCRLLDLVPDFSGLVLSRD